MHDDKHLLELKSYSEATDLVDTLNKKGHVFYSTFTNVFFA